MASFGVRLDPNGAVPDVDNDGYGRLTISWLLISCQKTEVDDQSDTITMVGDQHMACFHV